MGCMCNRKSKPSSQLKRLCKEPSNINHYTCLNNNLVFNEFNLLKTQNVTQQLDNMSRSSFNKSILYTSPLKSNNHITKKDTQYSPMLCQKCQEKNKSNLDLEIEECKHHVSNSLQSEQLVKSMRNPTKHQKIGIFSKKNQKKKIHHKAQNSSFSTSKENSEDELFQASRFIYKSQSPDQKFQNEKNKIETSQIPQIKLGLLEIQNGSSNNNGLIKQDQNQKNLTIQNFNGSNVNQSYEYISNQNLNQD